MDVVRLFNDDWEIHVDTVQGAIFTSCKYKEHDVFREMLPPNEVLSFAPFLSGNFPLHPFSNRVANGIFEFQEKSVDLKANIEGEPLPLHGFGLINAWSVIEHTEESCRLQQHIKINDWPWEYNVIHTISIQENKLRLELCVTNLSNSSMPCGFGFHPYFPNLQTALIAFDSDGIWHCGDDRLPTEWTPSQGDYNFSQKRRLQDFNLDHCFTNVSNAQITWENSPLTIKITSSQNLSRAAVYTDHTHDSFCFEPVSHTHNALNADDPIGEGIQVLAPSETTSCWTEFTIEV